VPRDGVTRVLFAVARDGWAYGPGCGPRTMAAFLARGEHAWRMGVFAMARSGKGGKVVLDWMEVA
jgi:hypothetical protein